MVPLDVITVELLPAPMMLIALVISSSLDHVAVPDGMESVSPSEHELYAVVTLARDADAEVLVAAFNILHHTIIAAINKHLIIYVDLNAIPQHIHSPDGANVADTVPFVIIPVNDLYHI
jgi:hypothetical protein